MTGFDTNDVTVTGGTKGAFGGSGDEYTLAITPTSGSNVVVTVDANSATDSLNTGPASAQSATATWDATAPTVSITGIPDKIKTTTALTATFAFSEDVTGFDTNDVTVTGGTKGAFGGSGDEYTLAITPTSGSNVVVTVDANSATDGLNAGPASAQSATATWDATAPTVSITGIPDKIKTTDALTATFTFSEDVTGFDTNDVTVAGGTKGAFGGSGDEYTLAITPTSGSNVVVTVDANSATDSLNTGPASAESATAVWDATAPTVEITGIPDKIKTRANLTATFTFSEAVTGFAANDVRVTGGVKGTFAEASATAYTLVVTPDDGADVVVTVRRNAASDGLNDGPASAQSATATWDAAAPTVEITGIPGKIKTRANLTATFTFSEAVTGFAASDIGVTGGVKGTFTESSATAYTLVVTPDDGSDVVVTVAADAATDGLNTGPASAESATAIWDAAAPTVEISGVPARTSSRAAFTATFTFSEDVTGFDTTDVSVTNGTKGAFGGSGDEYTLAVTPAGDEDVTVTVAADAASDGLNTGPASAVSATATWDADAPGVAVGVPAKINSRTAFTATFTFSEDVTGFDTTDVSVTNGTKGAFGGSGDEYTLAVTPDGDEDVTVTVAEDAASDGANDGPASAVSATAAWDVAAPGVAVGVPAKINSRTAFTATFTFSEDVTGFDTTDVSVTNGAKGAFGGSGDEYTLAVTPAGDEDVTVTVAEDAASDGANDGPASAVSATAAWDVAAPGVAVGVPAKINSRTAFTATFTFSEDVTGFDTTDVSVTNGTKGAFGGSGDGYTLAVTPAGDEDVTVTVAANAASDGINTGPASAASAAAIWDETAPGVTVGVPAKINSRTPFTATLTFSEIVTGFDTTDVSVTNGAKGAFGGSGTDYTLVVTPDGDEDVTVTVAEDAASDGINDGPTAAAAATATWDDVAPTAEIGDVPAKINSRTAFTATFTFSEDVTGFDTNDVSVTGGAKGAFGGSGDGYTLAVTPDGDEDVTVTVAADAASDGVNAGPASAAAATAVWDASRPTVAIGGLPTRIVTRAPLTATFDFSEAVTGFDADDVAVAGGAKGAFTATSATAYALAVTPDGGGADVTVTVAAGAASDGVNTGPANDASAAAAWGWDVYFNSGTASVTEGPNAEASIALVLSSARAEATTVRVQYIAVTAGAPGDYTGRPTSVVFPAGETQADLLVPITDDDEREDAETFIVRIVAGLLPADLRPGGTTSATVTINDDDSGAPASAGAAPVVAEAIPDQRAVVGRAFSYTFPVGTFTDDDDDTLSYAATRGDGTALPAWLTFAAASRVFSGTPEAADAGALTVLVTADDGNGNSAVDEFNIEVEPAPATVALSVSGGGETAEGGAALTITATRSEANTSGAALVIPIQVKAAGTTAGAGDYTVAASISIADNDSAGTATFAAADDSDDEPAETVAVELGALPAGNEAGDPSEVEITIADNDATSVTLAGADGDVVEGSTKTFTITLNRGLVDGEALPVPLDFGGDATRGTDYTTACPTTLPTGVTCANLDSGNAAVTFTGPTSGATATSVTLTLTAATDSAAEDDGETVAIGLGALDANSGTNLGGGASGADNLEDFSITDPVPAGVTTAQPADTEVTEGDATDTATFTVALDSRPTSGVTVTVAAPAGLELDGPDSAAAFTSSEPLAFTAGNWDAPQTVTLRATEDNADSPSGRQLDVTYSTASPDSAYSGLTGTAATVTAADNDPTSVTLAGAPGDVAEGGARTFTITLNRGLVNGEALPVPLTFGGAATRGTDYTTACPSTPPTGVACANLDSGNAAVTFTGPTNGATATSVALTLTAATDSAAEGGGETVAIGLGALDANSGTNLEGGASGADNLADFLITDPPATDTSAPTVEISGIPARINSAAALTAAFTFSEAVTGFDTNDVTVAGGTKGAFATTSAAVYTLVVTPDGGADVTVTVAADAASDGVNAGPSSAVSATAIWDAVAPTVEISGIPAKINGAGALTATFTFSEDVTGFDADDVAVAGGAKGAFTATSAAVYALAVTPDGDADVTVTAAAGAATDGVNAGPSSAVSATAIWDAVAPTVEISGIPARINSTGALTATFTFSEAVTGFDADDVAVAGGDKGAFGGSGTDYTLAVTPDGDEDVTVTVAAAAATDGINTGPASAAAATAAWDASAPTVEIGGIPARINSTGALTATFTFSEAVTGFDADDVAVAGGDKGAFAATSATVYTLALMPDGNADVTVTVAADAATDGVNTGPASAVSATATWGADAAPAVVVSGSPVSLVEGGASGSYTVALATDPGGAVTVTPSSGDAGAVTVSGALTFNADNWSRPQTVAVSAVDDDDSADETVTIRHAVGGYPGVDSAPDVTVAVADDDSPPAALPVVSVSAGPAVVEGGEALFTITADPAPEGEITVGAEVSATGGFVAAAALGARSVTLSASQPSASLGVATVGDEIDEADGTVSVALQSGTGYALSQTDASASLAVADDDATAVSLSSSTADAAEDRSVTVTVTIGRALEAGERLEVELSLGGDAELGVDYILRAPDVIPPGVEYAMLDTAPRVIFNGSATASSLSRSVFASASAFSPAARGALPGAAASSLSAPIIIVPIADSSGERGDRSVSVSIAPSPEVAPAAPADSTDGSVESINIDIAEPTVVDPSLTVSETSLSLDEGGSASYTVALGAAPSGTVAVAVAVSDGAGVSVSPTSLSFTADNWSMPQTVTVAALEDDGIADQSGALIHTASGGGYGGVSAEVSVSVMDNDDPSLTVSEASLSLDEGASASYTVALGAAPSGAVAVAVAVSDGAGVSVSPASLSFTADNWSMPQTVTVAALEDDGIDDESGALIHTASGGSYGGVSAEVAVMVADDDEPSVAGAAGAWMPRFGRVASEQILEGVGDRVASRRSRNGTGSEAAGGEDGGGFKIVFAGRGLDSYGAVAGGYPGGGRFAAGASGGEAGSRGFAGGQRGAFAGRVDGGGRGSRSSPSADPDGYSGGAATLAGAGGGRGSRPFPIPDAGGYPAAAEPSGARPAGGGAYEARPLGRMLRGALANSSFNAGGRTAGGADWGLWGRGSVATLEGRSADGVRVDGDVTTGQVGADWASGLWLFGISASHSRGEGDYSDDAGGGSMESSMTALTPYASMDAGRFSAWGALSAGGGDMTLTPEGGAAVDADIDMRMGAAGLRGELMDLGGGRSLSLVSDAMAMRSAADAAAGLPEAKARTSRVRAAVEASWTRELADGGEFSARLEGGLRHDGGDAEEGLGAEVSAGVSWKMRCGLAAAVEGRRLLAHKDGDFSQTGASAHLAWEACGAGGLGPSASLRRRWGIATASGLEQLFAMRRMGRFGLEPDASGLDAELGWGVALPGGRFLGTPFVLYGTQAGGSLQTLGWRMKPLGADGTAANLGMALKLVRRTGAADNEGHGILLEARLGF